MIRIFLGNPGSGKSLSCVREMIVNESDIITFSNIKTDHIKNNILISRDMIIKKELISPEGKPEKFRESLNVAFWQEAIKEHGALNVVIDEAHTIFNSRRSMSKTNIIVSDFLALIRRMIGGKGTKHGTLTLISQLHGRIDTIAREMATQIRYHVFHVSKHCNDCGVTWFETNMSQQQFFSCPKCGNKDIIEFDRFIEVWCFNDMNDYLSWKDFGMKTFYDYYVFNKPEKYFDFYDTMQLDNLISNY